MSNSPNQSVKKEKHKQTKASVRPKTKPKESGFNNLKPAQTKQSREKASRSQQQLSTTEKTLPTNDCLSRSPESVSDILFTPSKRAQTISLSLIAKRCLDLLPTKHNPDELIEKLSSVTHVRLDREGIFRIDGLELLGHTIRNLYLQHNEISCIEGLETLSNLRFLTLSHNNITVLENLKHLKRLGFLDLSYNKIDHMDIDELPVSLVILSLQDNPCQGQPDYRASILRHCTQLSQLDEEQLSLEERRQAGHDVTSESDDSDEDELVKTYDYNKPFDADIIGVFDDLSTDIFLRCQSRVQQVFAEHKEHILSLERIKNTADISVDETNSVTTSRLSSRFNSPDTTDSSRPATGNLSQRSYDM